MADTQRETLIQQALQMGLDESMIKRATTYSIEKMIASAGVPRTEKKRSKVENHIRPSFLKENKAEIDDDAKTVVDMSFATATTNPADQKYQRFRFLTATKNDLMTAIKNNTGLYQANLDHLDEDDVLIMQKEIQEVQSNLALVNTELHEIHQWFNEMHVQKQRFYEEFLKKSADISGKLTSHFQKKMDNIQQYMTSMENQ